MTSLLELKTVKPRFARSINVERDADSDAIDGYLPVGRAIDVVARFATALDRDDVEVAISVTGPYGSGKSSLAIILDALTGPKNSNAFKAAIDLVGSVDNGATERIKSARKKFGADTNGFIRAVVTAQRESILLTVLRALVVGVDRYSGAGAKTARARATFEKVKTLFAATQKETPELPTSRDIRDLIAQLGEIAPVLLLIDEFGKNLEAFADSRSDADLFLLQDLAEWSRGGDGIPLALVTLQHLAFDEYADTASASQRREWSKIQGRFDDIPFVDSPAQTRALIAAAFTRPEAKFRKLIHEWAAEESARTLELGLTELVNERLLEDCWPLHPVALGVLPELCERYGQNERTLFSFLGGHEPLTVATFMAESPLPSNEQLPSVRLDRLYDYFIDSAANLASVSANASRWVEIDLRVRDASAVSEGARRVLKTIGILNLVSSGGAMRASRSIIGFAAADGREGTENEDAVAERVSELEAVGLVTYRGFADEFRIWQGSDFDLKSSVELSRSRIKAERPDHLLEEALRLPPLIASRVSYETGALRALDQAWITSDSTEVTPLGVEDLLDGSVFYVLGESAPTSAVRSFEGSKPLSFVLGTQLPELVSAAVEVVAINRVIETEDSLQDDWVARRELQERLIEAEWELRHRFHESFSEQSARWIMQNEGGGWLPPQQGRASTLASELCSLHYSKSPVIRNDMMNRHELSSQGSKARRVLVEQMVKGRGSEALGIEGFGPEKTLFLTVLEELGLYEQIRGTETYNFTSPREGSGLLPLWNYLLEDLLRSRESQRSVVSDLYQNLAAPPFGLRAGLAPIIFMAALILHGDEIALYEHGTFRPSLTDDVLERLLKNPGNFEVKHFSSRTGSRGMFLQQLIADLEIPATWGKSKKASGGVLAVLAEFVRTINMLPDYSKKTTAYAGKHVVALRSAISLATEPDVLLFEDAPKAVGCEPIKPRAKLSSEATRKIAKKISSSFKELSHAYPNLLQQMAEQISLSLGIEEKNLKGEAAARAEVVSQHATEERLMRFLVALSSQIPDREGWLEYVGMMVVGTPPQGWSDEDAQVFKRTVAELGQSFDRLYQMNVHLEGLAEGSKGIRIVATSSENSEFVRFIAFDDTMQTQVERALQPAVAEIAKNLAVSKKKATEILLGVLTEQLGESK